MNFIEGCHYNLTPYKMTIIFFGNAFSKSHHRKIPVIFAAVQKKFFTGYYF